MRRWGQSALLRRQPYWDSLTVGLDPPVIKPASDLSVTVCLEFSGGILDWYVLVCPYLGTKHSSKGKYISHTKRSFRLFERVNTI